MALISKHKNDYEGIRNLAEGDADLPLRTVRLSSWAPKGLLGRVRAFGVRLGVAVAMPIFRRFPVVKFFDLYWITRDEEVRAVLADHEAFEVPFGLEMRHITKGPTFCLGDDGELHHRQRSALEDAWKGMDDEKDVRAPARRFAQALLADSGGEVDVVGDLIRQVVARVSEKLLGCEISDYAAHSESVVAVASFLFGDPYGKEFARKEGLVAARNLKPTIDKMVAASIDGLSSQSDGFIGIIPGMARALKRHLDSGNDPDYDLAALKGDLEATGYGMTTAFAVTHGFTGGVLQTLGRRPWQFSRARDLCQRIKNARAISDKEAEKTLLAEFETLMMEASRFNPAIFPGSFRVRTEKPMKQASAHPKLNRIPLKKTVMVCTASAVRDNRCRRNECRNPDTFDPGRFDHDEIHTALGFGHGIHACVGARQAISIASEVLIELLSQPALKFVQRWPRVVQHGPVHATLKMTFDPDIGAQKQTQILAPIPLREGLKAEDAARTLRILESEGHLKEAFDASNVVHFASLHILALGKIGKERDHLLVELNVDGSMLGALSQIRLTVRSMAKSAAAIETLAAMSEAGSQGASNRVDGFFSTIRAKAAKLTQLPFGDTGGNFVGTGEFSVRQIEEEARLANFAEAYLVDQAQLTAAKEKGLSDAEWSTRLFSLTRDKVRASEFANMLIRLKHRGPQFARQRYIPFTRFLVRYFKQPAIVLTLAIYGLVSTGTLLAAIVLEKVSIVHYLVVTLTPILVLLSLLAGLFLWLRRREKTEIPDDRIVDLERLRKIRAAEERTNYAQTHITSLSAFKVGLFRRLTFALAMHVITAFVRLWFRPGFLTDFATIHYARWVRFSGTDQLVFQSNYDGSWESYLEDFITKVHQGQTIAWNNAKGFPKTNFLWFDGARNGDRFKRWVRNQQQDTPFWYSRFPNLTIPQIHRNALIRDGLARARDVSDHRDWLKLFGSLPQKGTELETDQVQSLIFSGHGNHRAAQCIPIKFNDPHAACKWLKTELSKARDTKSASDVANAGGSGGPLLRPGPSPPALSFGDGEPISTALFIGFSAQGLAKLGVPKEAQCGLNAFPSPFLDGMRGRGAALNDPLDVIWSDAGWYSDVDAVDPQSTGNSYTSGFKADAVLLIYMKPVPRMDGNFGNRFDQAVADLEIAIDLLKLDLRDAEISYLDAPIDLSRPPGEDASLGGFGFHEGASQPVIRGSRQAARRHVQNADIMEPGEFLLGYEDSRGFVPPAITLRSDQATHETLPFAVPSREEPFPHFGNPDAGHMFDLGRNGSYLAIRQLEHLRDSKDIEVFDNFVTKSAHIISEQIKAGRPMAGDGADVMPGSAAYDDGWEARTDAGNQVHVGSFSSEHEFLKDLTRAKLLGRWRDGSSLVRHPLLSATSLVRQRTYRELADGPLAEIARFANEMAIRRFSDLPPDEEPDPSAYDRLLWDNQIWDAFIEEFRAEL